MIEIGKIPPQAIEVEESLLGILMLYPESIDQVLDMKLIPEYFYKDSHQKIFIAILALYKEKKPFDIISVTEKLKSENTLESVGGAYFISLLTNKAPGSYQATYFSRIIKDKYVKRSLILLSSELQKMAFDESIEVDECFDFVNDNMKSIESNYDFDIDKSFETVIEESVKLLEERNRNYLNGISVGIKTPILDLTRAINGWQKSLLYVIAARPSMGKTAWMIAISKKAARNGYSPVIFSLEMTTNKLIDRMLIGESGVNANDFTSGNVNSSDWKAIEKSAEILKKWSVSINDKSGISISSIERRCRRLQKNTKCDLVIIDYLQLAKPENSSKNREAEVAEMSRACKTMAKNLNIPVIILAQINRESEKTASKKPLLSQLRESGAIEADADVVGLLYRAEYYGIETFEDGSLTKGIGIINIAKQRDGMTGDIKFKYNESLTRIYDCVDDSMVPSGYNNYYEKDKEDKPF